MPLVVSVCPFKSGLNGTVHYCVGSDTVVTTWRSSHLRIKDPQQSSPLARLCVILKLNMFYVVQVGTYYKNMFKNSCCYTFLHHCTFIIWYLITLWKNSSIKPQSQTSWESAGSSDPLRNIHGVGWKLIKAQAVIQPAQQCANLSKAPSRFCLGYSNPLVSVPQCEHAFEYIKKSTERVISWIWAPKPDCY